VPAALEAGQGEDDEMMEQSGNPDHSTTVASVSSAAALAAAAKQSSIAGAAAAAAPAVTVAHSGRPVVTLFSPLPPPQLPDSATAARAAVAVSGAVAASGPGGTTTSATAAVPTNEPPAAKKAHKLKTTKDVAPARARRAEHHARITATVDEYLGPVPAAVSAAVVAASNLLNTHRGRAPPARPPILLYNKDAGAIRTPQLAQVSWQCGRVYARSAGRNIYCSSAPRTCT
jgi:hypothetical protein